MNITTVSTVAAASAKEQTRAVDANAVTGDPEIPGFTFNPDDHSTFVFGKSPEEQAKFDYGVSLYHRALPMSEADDAMKNIDKQLAKLDKVIAKQRPGLASADWDFTVEKGKIKVTGSASKEDKQWLEHKLNSDELLTTAVTTYMHAAVDYLETSDDNPAYLMQMSRITGASQYYDFKDVQKQLEGNISFKKLNTDSWNLYKNARSGGFDDPGNSRGSDTLEMLASMLKVSSMPQWVTASNK